MWQGKRNHDRRRYAQLDCTPLCWKLADTRVTICQRLDGTVSVLWVRTLTSRFQCLWAAGWRSWGSTVGKTGGLEAGGNYKRFPPPPTPWNPTNSVANPTFHSR
jgi:hypothetical protein